jgi:molecular chaperone DnaK (HSP70)
VIAQVSADVLRHLLQLAAEALGGSPPQQVVITVPAYFDTQQRAATLQAAQLAGIQQVCGKHFKDTTVELLQLVTASMDGS